MKRVAGILVIVLVAGAATCRIWVPAGPVAPQPFLGYVEAETLLIAPKQSGRLTALATAEGETVAPGDALFALDAEAEQAALAEAAARLRQAHARLADLRAAQQRPAEIEILEARRRQAEAVLDLSRRELDRQQRLFRERVTPQARLDEARTALRRDRNALAEIERQIQAARLPGREAVIAAAEAEVEAGRAALAQARIALADRRVAASQGGRIVDVIYRTGEVVPAGAPVVEVLPPENVRIHFYVPEPRVLGLAHGQRVAIRCDGCPRDLTGEIIFIASEAEFTPPVIFSRQERAKLVFLVKARPTQPAPALKTGLPVEVYPQ